MRSLTKVYTITEYSGFVRGGLPFGNYQPLPERTFDALESFILANHSATISFMSNDGVNVEIALWIY